MLSMESYLLCQMPALKAVLKGKQCDQLQEMSCLSWAEVGWDAGYTFPSYPSCCLIPLMQSTSGKSCIEVKDESKGIKCNAGLAKGHDCSRRTCFNAEPKLGTWRLHLALAVQHSTCQRPLPPNQASCFGLLVCH